MRNLNRRRFKASFLLLVIALIFLFAPCAHASGIPLIMRGTARTLFSVLQIPKDMIVNSPKAFPLGLIGGTMVGTMKAVTGTVVGAVDIARGAAPYAKYLVFL